MTIQFCSVLDSDLYFVYIEDDLHAVAARTLQISNVRNNMTQ